MSNYPNDPFANSPAPPVAGSPPQHGAGQHQYQPQPGPTSVNGLAIASMVLGILWLWWVGSILAVIFGFVSLGQIKRANGRATGRGMAIAGLVLGFVGVGTLLIVIIAAASVSGS